jgi:PAS domain S-box-containing protein
MQARPSVCPTFSELSEHRMNTPIHTGVRHTGHPTDGGSTAEPHDVLRAPDRLAALRDAKLLDTPAEAQFDRVTRLAAHLMEAPVAVVSLVDDRRVFVKSSVGRPDGAPRTVSLSHSLSRHVVAAGEPLVVEDARTEPRLMDTPAVAAEGVAAYAGVPLRTAKGYVVGALAVYDRRAHAWTDAQVRLLQDLAGAVEAEIELRLDAHRREASRRALEEAESRYRMLLDALPVVVYIAEPTPPYSPIYVSPSMASLGYPVDEWFSRPDLWARSIHPDDRERVMALTGQALQHGGKTDYEYRIIGGDGEVRYVHDQGEFAFDEQGRPQFWQGVIVDVTERQRAVIAARDQRRQIRQIIDVVPHMLFVKDAEGRFLIVNEAMARAYGTTAHALEGRLERDAMEDAELAARFHAEDLEVIRSGRPKVIPEKQFQLPDGRVRVMNTMKVPFRMEGGDVPAVLCLARDVTEELEKDRSLRRAERLAVVGTMVGGVAHELNNPLAAIKGFTDLLMMERRSDDDAEALEFIRREADRAARIVADLRRLARQTQEKGAHKPTDLNDVVRHVLRVRAYALQTRNVEVRAELDPTLPPVLADRGQMEQVILNLLVNAEQAVAAGGRCAGLVSVRTVGEERRVRVCVADDGPGIAPEHAEHVFDPFWTTKAPGEGTGLGLSLVHSIVTEHGGAVRVDSEPGRGATFTVCLPSVPAGEAEPAPPAPAPAPAPVERRLRVLVVDDEPAIRRTLVRALERQGHRVTEAHEGSTALTRLAELGEGEAYDVILSDLRMPGLGGAELLERLREQGKGMDRRLIFITGDAVSPDAAEILADAHVPVLMKPYDLREVLGMIERQARAA